jgi:hypothetical protein
LNVDHVDARGAPKQHKQQKILQMF